MSSTKTYDVCIIGSGPGGYVAAVRAGQLGLSVLIVEKDSRLGGVCTLRGCIPTKALLHTADLLEEARHGADVGVEAREVKLELPAAMKHKEKVVRQSSNGVTYLMKKNRVDVANGFGRIVGVGEKVGVTPPTARKRLSPPRTSSSRRAPTPVVARHGDRSQDDPVLRLHSEVTEVPEC
jgi:pyruvate/2-oxoglutarate dehydrogenase complex dihydrolipoamide dehydrogenase (E3) component